MFDELSPEMIAERDDLLAEIDAAFDGVTREGGISWSEAAVWGCGRSIEQEARVRASDTEERWQDLVDDEEWEDGEGFSSSAFLDAIGYRYYLPATILRCVRGDESDYVVYRLMGNEGGPSDYQLEQWSLLDTRQRRCVARFLSYMIRPDATQKGSAWHHGGQLALDRYWSAFLPGSDRNEP